MKLVLKLILMYLLQFDFLEKCYGERGDEAGHLCGLGITKLLGEVVGIGEVQGCWCRHKNSCF